MTHLSSGQISEWILGERDAEIEQHVETCDTCHRDIALLQDGLLAFQQSVREWAEQPAVLRAASVPERRVPWGWAAGVAAILSVVLLPMYLDVREAQREAKTAQDSLLLKQVHAHLARTVPQSMEHLMELMNEGMNKEKRGPQ